uniref:TerD family protein n=1 Tax=Streptomyces sp. NBC_00003 TaxID=2903608 RepID=A0AAU2VBL1_9ACTN
MAAQQQLETESATVERFRTETTTAHLQDFPSAAPPVVPSPPARTEAWALGEAKRFHRQGISLVDRAGRAAAKERVQAEAPVYLADERQRLAAAYEELRGQADAWWRGLLANDTDIVCEALNFAYADNRALACAVGVEGGTVSVVMRQPDADSWPERVPGLTSGGRPTMKALTKRDRNAWWLSSLCAHLTATLREGFAVAPSLQVINVAVLTRIPATHRLGVVTYGSWSRHRLEAARWLTAEDALRVLDLAEEVTCAVTATSSGIKALDLAREPALADLLRHTVDEDAPGAGDLSELDAALTATTPPPGGAAVDPYAPLPYATWHSGRHPSTTPAPAAATERWLTTGQNTPLLLPTDGIVTVDFTTADAPADVSVLLLGEHRQVASDADFVFYNQPASACGSVRLFPAEPTETTQVRLNLLSLPPHVRTLAVAINADVDTETTLVGLHQSQARVHAADHTWCYAPAVDPALAALVVLELYRDSRDPLGATWKVRAVGQGWADGLAGLARDHGVHVA